MRYVVLVFILSAISLFSQQPNEIWKTHESRMGKSTFVIDDGKYFFVANDVNGVIRYKKNSEEYVEMFDMGGIQSPKINYLAKDSSGVIWAAGNKGLFRWDGKDWNYLDLSDKIESFISKIDRIHIDKRGKIWMLGLSDEAHDQIGYYYNDTTFWFDNNQVPDRFLIEDVAFDSTGNFWAIANTVRYISPKFIKISPANDFVYWDSTNGLNPQDLGLYNLICTDIAQNVWFAGKKSIYKISPNENIERFRLFSKDSIGTEDSLHYSSKSIKAFGNRIYSFGDYGYSLWDGTKWNNYKIDTSCGKIVDVKEYGDSIYVVLTTANLYLLNKYSYSISLFPIQSKFQFDYVQNMSDIFRTKTRFLNLEKDKSLYLINHYLGIEGFSENKWMTYVDLKYFPKVKLASPCSNKNDMWFAIKGGLTETKGYSIDFDFGLLRFDGVTCQLYNKYNSQMLSDTISSIYNDKQHTMWFGYGYKKDSAAVSKFDGTNWKHFSFKVPNGLAVGSVNSIYQDFLGDIWFLVTYYKKSQIINSYMSQDKSTYLYKMTSDEVVTEYTPGKSYLGESYPNKNNTMAMTSDSTLWIATMQVYSATDKNRVKWGLYSVKGTAMNAHSPGQNTKYDYDGCSISSLTDVDGEIWCGLIGNYSYAMAVGGIGRYRCDGNFSTDWLYETKFYADIIDESCISKYDSIIIYSVNDLSRMNDSTITLTISYQKKNSEDFYNIQALAFLVNGRLIIRNDIPSAENFVLATDGSLWGRIIKGRYANEQFIQISNVNYLSVSEMFESQDEEVGIVIYPNPANDRLMIVDPLGASVSFIIYDINGNAIEMKDIERLNESTYSLNVAKLVNGTYLIIGDDGIKGKFVIRK